MQVPSFVSEDFYHQIKTALNPYPLKFTKIKRRKKKLA